MFKKFAFLAIFLAIAPNLAHAVCSRANLTRCLDSVCAINVSTNPAARCQYCGTTNAGEPPTKNGIKSVSVGASTRFNVSDKELKSAPNDPGQRYVWATTKCIERVTDCTPDDVSDVYDKLIEQSCTAAGINAQMATLHSKATKKKTQTACSGEISACLMGNKKCASDFSACTNDADFNKFFAACSTESTGCDDYISAIRAELLSSRDAVVKNADAILESIVKSYADARENRINNARAKCTNNSGRETCIKQISENRMANKCAAGFNDEKSMATQLCKYYDTACATLK
jgi:hypothetical protein